MNLEKRIFLVENEPRQPSENLAINRYCIELVKNGSYDLIARAYTHRKGIILGRGESLGDVNEEFCNLKGYEIVERPSGGSVVVVNEDLVLCYSIFFNWKAFNFGNDIGKLYKAVTIPLAKRLGKNISVEGAYYLRANLGDSKIPFAGHAARVEGEGIQFDGIINKTKFDIGLLGKLIKLRELYSYNGELYILLGNEAYNLKGERVYDFNSERAKLVRDERKELGKILGLRELGINEKHFIDSLYDTINEVFGITQKTGLKIKEDIKKLAQEIKDNSKGGKKGLLGHCFVDFIEPEPRIHYAVCV